MVYILSGLVEDRAGLMRHQKVNDFNQNQLTELHESIELKRDDFNSQIDSLIDT